MQSQLRTSLAGVLLAGALLAGCDAFAPRTPLPDLLPGAVRIKTWDSDPGAGNLVRCGAIRSADPVVGTLDGEASGDPFSTWLLADGLKLFVIWPRGFSARFEPTLQLIDSSNVVVAQRGEPIDLNVSRGSVPGTE